MRREARSLGVLLIVIAALCAGLASMRPDPAAGAPDVLAGLVSFALGIILLYYGTSTDEA
jgi:hypothetical protein